MQPPRRLHAAATSRQSFAALRPLLCSWPSLPSGLHAPCALSRLATGRTRAAPGRRRSAALRPGADRRITRKAAGGSWADTFMPPFTRRGLSGLRGVRTARSHRRALGHTHGRGEAGGRPRPEARWSAGPPHRTLSAGSLSLPAGELRGARAAHGQPVPPSRRGVPARPLPSVLTPRALTPLALHRHLMWTCACGLCVVCSVYVSYVCFPCR